MRGSSDLHFDTDDIAGQLVEIYAVRAMSRYIEVLRDVGATLPIVVLVTVLDASGRWLVDSRAWHRGDLPRIDRNTVALPDVLVDAWDADVPTALRPVFDAFWQSGGVARSPSYDEDGNWTEPA